MEKIDTLAKRDLCDEELFLSEVACGDAELLYLDSYLTELFRKE
jgi:hypothetical protein